MRKKSDHICADLVPGQRFPRSWVGPAGSLASPVHTEALGPVWGSWPNPSPGYRSLPFPENTEWERVNSWVCGIMVFLCFVLLDVMHRKMPRTSNNYSKTTLLPSRGHSRQAGAQRHCRVSDVTVRGEKQEPGTRNPAQPQAQRGAWQKWEKGSLEGQWLVS